jgi:hypothetical protein
VRVKNRGEILRETMVKCLELLRNHYEAKGERQNWYFGSVAHLALDSAVTEPRHGRGRHLGPCVGFGMGFATSRIEGFPLGYPSPVTPSFRPCHVRGA